MSDEKPWIESLRKGIDAARCTDDSCISCNAFHMDDLMAAVMPHMESAYKVGRMKATARIGRRYVTRNLELSRKLRLVREQGPKAIWALKTPEPSGSEHYRSGWADGLEAAIEALRTILGNEEIASEAEADIRKKALLEGAAMVCVNCETPVGWVDCPTGGWWAHQAHPSDDHDALPRPVVAEGDA